MVSVGWTEAGLRAELERICAGRQTFPTWTEFEQMGLRSLRKVVDRHGGARRWAGELGLQVARPGPAKGQGGRPRDPRLAERRQQQAELAEQRAELRARAVAMRRSGMSAAAIAVELDRHLSTIHTWLRAAAVAS